MYATTQEFANACDVVTADMSPVPAEPSIRHDTRSGRLQRLGALYGACSAMQRLFHTIGRLGPSDVTVMILGESGSGKELVAQAIHQLSARSRKAFVAVNCGALPENLIESELFGHERGSFTGAARTHRGCFERADGGTLFLDEVTEMPVDMQVRLLRVLETGRFCRVGGDQEITASVRVIAASNRDLGQAVAEGRLREDLMYRLCVIPLPVPPLRDRDADALLLAEMFLTELNDAHGTNKTYTHRARARIAAFSWPGNVRELKNVIHRGYVLSDDEVEVDVPDSTQEAMVLPQASSTVMVPSMPSINSAIAARASAPCGGLKDVTIRVGTSLDDAERALIMATLDSVSGSKAKAAQVLGISLKTLYNRLHAYRDSELDAAQEIRPPVMRADVAMAA
ncbi:MAG TPA: sigma-54 dependent transcriptional regulator [Casimicrobiaceae bacterium]|jgi:DNA-binding NtrC family response regulator|nr:sigma-54 dependent transcriptional regulator [Casimicrobiaceae bacterium]